MVYQLCGSLFLFVRYFKAFLFSRWGGTFTGGHLCFFHFPPVFWARERERESYSSLPFHLPSIICWCARKPWARSVFFTKSSGNGWFCKKKERESQSNGPLTHSRFCKISIQLLQTSHHLVSPAMWRLQLPWKPDHTYSPWQQKLHPFYHANEPRPPPSTHPLPF